MLQIIGCFLATFLTFSSIYAVEPIIIDAEDAAGPWGQQDGTGAGNEIVVAAYKAAGIDVKLKIVPYARCKKEVMGGDVAGCFGMSPNPETEATVVMAKEPLYGPTAGFFAAKNTTSPKDLASITKGTRIGTVNGYEYPAEVMKLAERGVVFEKSESEVQNFAKLAANRIQFAVAMVDEIKTPEFLINKSGTKDAIEHKFAVNSDPTYLGFNKNDKFKFAKEKFEEGFTKIKINGTLASIIAKWKENINAKK